MWCCATLLFSGGAGAVDYVTLSGQELYAKFCASCHGPLGRGDGPVAKTLPREVPDLTLFARRHGGEFPRDLAERIVDGRYMLAAHGTRTMPVWGEDLTHAAIGDPNAERATRIVTGRLADYLWLLQRPTAAVDAPVTSSKTEPADAATKPRRERQ
jgi:mono/diheme cytochrome c family protein